MASSCEEGFGSVEFRAAQERLTRMAKEAFRMSVRRKDRSSIDEWQTVMLLRALDQGKIDLYSEFLSGEEIAISGAVPVRDLTEELSVVMARVPGRRLAVIPEGPYSCALRPSSSISWTGWT